MNDRIGGTMEENVMIERDGEKLNIHLSGKISSTNAPEVEKAITEELHDVTSVEADCSALEYISSAGLRVILRIKKSVPDTVLTNVSAEVYDVFELTGFTEMMDIRKAFRKLSVEGCEVIGSGANGIVYRYDEETIIKVFKNPDSLADIKREQDLARTAFVLGVPTAISYDVVQVEGGLYGSVFELLNADSYQGLLLSGQKTIDEIADMSVELLKTVHSRLPKEGALPSKKAIDMKRIEATKSILEPEDYQRLLDLYNAIPENGHMLHGDFHIKNVMIQNGESLLIDMDTICTGDPVFEFSGMYVAYRAFAELDPEDPFHFFGLTADKTGELFDKILAKYFEGTGIDQTEVLDKARIISYARILYYCATGKHVKPEDREKTAAHFYGELKELLWKVTDLSSHVTY